MEFFWIKKYYMHNLYDVNWNSNFNLIVRILELSTSRQMIKPSRTLSIVSDKTILICRTMRMGYRLSLCISFFFYIHLSLRDEGWTSMMHCARCFWSNFSSALRSLFWSLQHRAALLLSFSCSSVSPVASPSGHSQPIIIAVRISVSVSSIPSAGHVYLLSICRFYISYVN